MAISHFGRNRSFSPGFDPAEALKSAEMAGDCQGRILKQKSLRRYCRLSHVPSCRSYTCSPAAVETRIFPLAAKETFVGEPSVGIPAHLLSWSSSDHGFSITCSHAAWQQDCSPDP